MGHIGGVHVKLACFTIIGHCDVVIWLKSVSIIVLELRKLVIDQTVDAVDLNKVQVLMRSDSLDALLTGVLKVLKFQRLGSLRNQTNLFASADFYLYRKDVVDISLGYSFKVDHVIAIGVDRDSNLIIGYIY